MSTYPPTTYRRLKITEETREPSEHFTENKKAPIHYCVLGNSNRVVNAFRSQNHIVLVMHEDFAKLISDETEDGCADALILYDALQSVGIGRRNFDVSVSIEFTYNVGIHIEDAENEDEAADRAIGLVKNSLPDYVDTTDLMKNHVVEITCSEVWEA